MGMDTSIVNTLLPTEIPIAFLPHSRIAFEVDCTAIIDLMKFRFSFINQNRSTEMTPSQAVHVLNALIMKCVALVQPAHRLKQLVLITDKSLYVPKEKRAEQLKRAQSRLKSQNGAIPYPADKVFRSDETYDMVRLMITSHLTIQFWRTFALQSVASYDFGVDTVVFDYPGGFMRRRGTKELFDVAQVANQFGEADIAIHYWMKYFEGGICVFTNDTDHLATGLSYLITGHHRHGQYLWIRAEKPRTYLKANTNKSKVPARMPLVNKRVNAPEHVEELTAIDMRALFDRLPSSDFVLPLIDVSSVLYNPNTNNRWQIEALICAFILCGTDYYDKKAVSHRFGADKIIAAALRAWPVLRASLLSRDTENAAGLEAVTRWLFHHRDTVPSGTSLIKASAFMDRNTRYYQDYHGNQGRLTGKECQIVRATQSG